MYKCGTLLYKRSRPSKQKSPLNAGFLFALRYNLIMRKFIFLLIIAIAVVSLFYITRNNSSPQLGFDKSRDSRNFKPDPSNGIFIFEDGPVTLTNGKNSKDDVETAILGEISYGDINRDGKSDAALLISQYAGGTGIFIYLAAYVSSPTNYKGTNTIFIGDRISPQKISIKDEVITVEYLDREEDESFATEPTIPVSKKFVFRNGALEER